MTIVFYIGMVIFSLLLLVFAAYYIPQRLSGLLGIRRRKTAIAIFSSTIVCAAWAMGAIGHVANPLLLALLKFSLIALGFAFYLFLFLLAYELLNRVIALPRKAAGIAVIALSMLVTGYGLIHARQHHVVTLDIPLAGLQEEVRIFHAPDVHMGPFRGPRILQAVIDDIERTQPDVVLFNGDLVDGLEGLEPGSLELLQQVTQPMYFTGGNHDIYVGIKEIKRRLRDIGVRVLENEIITTHGIQLIGLDYMNADDQVVDAHASPNAETIKSTLPELAIDQALPTVVVHHSPVGVSYMNDAGADLVLAGHTHAGQFFPATLFAKLQFPYLKGMYHYDDTRVYVSEGVGTFGPPIRVGTQAEVTLIRLIPSV